jgi:hypothetical protein
MCDAQEPFQTPIQGHSVVPSSTPLPLSATATVAALLEALRFYADGCDATETDDCGYEGNQCCKVARAAILKATQQGESK